MNENELIWMKLSKYSRTGNFSAGVDTNWSKCRNMKIQIKMLRKVSMLNLVKPRGAYLMMEEYLSLSRCYTSNHQSACSKHFDYFNCDSGAPCIKPSHLVAKSVNCSSCCVQVARGTVRANHSVNWRLARDTFSARDWSERGEPASRPVHFKPRDGFQDACCSTAP